MYSASYHLLLLLLQLLLQLLQLLPTTTTSSLSPNDLPHNISIYSNSNTGTCTPLVSVLAGALVAKAGIVLLLLHSFYLHSE